LKQTTIIIIAVVVSVVATLVILEVSSEIAFLMSPAGQQMQFEKQLEILIARAVSCGSITNTITTEQESKIVECKKNARESVRNLLEGFGIEDQRATQEFLNNHPEFFPKFYAEDELDSNEIKKSYDEIVSECKKIRKSQDDPDYWKCFNLAYKNLDSAQKFLEEYLAKQNP